MKKVLLLLAAAVVCLAANAQLLERSRAAALAPTPAPKAPVMKALAENQLYLGPYVSDALAQSGLGLANYSGNFQLGSVLPVEMVHPYSGSEIKAIRFGLSAPVTNAAVLLFSLESINPPVIGDTLVWQTVDSTFAGWNEVQLDNPVTINSEGIAGFLLGYRYRQVKGSTSASYPISMVKEGVTQLTLMNAGALTEKQWTDIGLAEYGNLSVQAIVENQNFPDYNLVLSGLTHPTIAYTNDEIIYNVNLSNVGKKTLNNYKIDVLLDGEVVSQIDSPVALTQMLTPYSGTVTFENLAPQLHTLSFRCIEIEGETVNGQVLDGHFFVYETAFKRQKQLVEQFTAQGCTYCPLAVNVLNAIDRQLGGEMAWVAIHNNFNGTDVFTIPKGAQVMNFLGADSYPSAAFNRFVGEDGMCIGLGYQAAYATQAAKAISQAYIQADKTPALVTLDLKGELDKANNQLKLTVSGESKLPLADFVGLSIYLTEDSLEAKQLNQGTWVQKFTHNHVLRDMPTEVTGDNINWTADDKFLNSYTIDLNSEWKTDNMSVIAFVNLKKGIDKNVLNCEMSTLNGLEPLPGIVGDINRDGLVDIGDINDLINMLLGAAEKTPAADLTGEGGVDVGDLNALINLMLNQ